MDEVVKFLRKCTAAERDMLIRLIREVKKSGRNTKNVIPLQGKSGWYRVRAGVFRIIFTQEQGVITIMRVTRRNENTYRKL